MNSVPVPRQDFGGVDEGIPRDRGSESDDDYSEGEDLDAGSTDGAVECDFHRVADQELPGDGAGAELAASPAEAIPPKGGASKKVFSKVCAQCMQRKSCPVSILISEAYSHKGNTLWFCMEPDCTAVEGCYLRELGNGTPFILGERRRAREALKLNSKPNSRSNSKRNSNPNKGRPAPSRPAPGRQKPSVPTTERPR
mgnify:CR=1 FL=1